MNDSAKRDRPPRWIAGVLIAAGVYNLGWGTLIVLLPNALFRLSGVAEPTYPGIWQCVGMIVGVYGFGYLIAARAPYRHWPIVFVGLLGKIFGPVGFVVSAASGQLPWSWTWMILTNDLLWWAPFGLILYRAFRENTAPSDEGRFELRAALANTASQRGATLLQLSETQPVLVVFLRHTGCTFCRQMLADLRDCRREIEGLGFQPAIVHMSDPMRATLMFDRYDLGSVHRFSDPECRLYRAFGIGRGTWSQLFGGRVVLRVFKAILVDGHGLGLPDGDGFRMQAALVLSNGQAIASTYGTHVAERIDFTTLLRQALSRLANSDQLSLATKGERELLLR